MELFLILFELVYIFNTLSQVMIIYFIWKKKHSEGISYYSQLINWVASYFRLIYFLLSPFKTYKLFWIEILFSLVVSNFLFYLMHKYQKLSIDQEKNYFDYRIIVLASVTLGFLSNLEKYSLNEFRFGFFAIRVAGTLECLSTLPQIRLMRKEKFVNFQIGLGLLMMVFARFIRVGFWVSFFTYFRDRSGYWMLVIIDVIHVILLIDFAYYFVKYRNTQMIPYD